MIRPCQQKDEGSHSINFRYVIIVYHATGLWSRIQFDSPRYALVTWIYDVYAMRITDVMKWNTRIFVCRPLHWQFVYMTCAVGVCWKICIDICDTNGIRVKRILHLICKTIAELWWNGPLAFPGRLACGVRRSLLREYQETWCRNNTENQSKLSQQNDHPKPSHYDILSPQYMHQYIHIHTRGK